MPVSESNKRAIKKYQKNKYDMIRVLKGTAHCEIIGAKESTVQFIARAIITQIELDDEFYGATTDISEYLQKKEPQPEEPLYYSITTNPNELQSVDGTKSYPVAVRTANARGDGYYIAVYNDISGKRQYVLKKNEKGDWEKTDEFDV